MLLLNLPLIVWFVRVKASQEGGVQLRGWQIRDRWKRLLADPPPFTPHPQLYLAGTQLTWGRTKSQKLKLQKKPPSNANQAKKR